jgi:hypothetical protein
VTGVATAELDEDDCLGIAGDPSGSLGSRKLADLFFFEILFSFDIAIE